MGFLDKVGSKIKSVAEEYNPTTKEGLINIGAGVATGGLYTAGHVPYTAFKDDIRALGRQLDPTKVGQADTSAMQAEKALMRDRQESLLQDQQTYIKGREAPQVGQMQAMNRGLVRDAYAMPIDYTPQSPYYGGADLTGQIGPIDTAQSQEALELARQQALGQGPNAASLLMRQGMERQAQQAMAMAAARGYNPAAVRQAQYQMAGAGQEAALEAAQLEAQQQIAGQQQFLTGTQQQQQMAQSIALNQAQLQQQAQIQRAQLQQEANTLVATQEGQIALAQAENQLRATLANQNIDLDILKSDALRGDSYALANLDAQLKAQGMDDKMVLAYLSAITGIDAKVLDAEIGLVKGEQDRQKAITAAKTTLAGGILKAGASAGATIATKKPTKE